MSESKVELKALKAPVSVVSTVDGNKSSSLITPEKPGVFNPKQNLRLSYAKAQSQNVQMLLNGKQINLPSARPGRNAIELEITSDNFKQILESGAITFNTNPTAAPR
jgi:hypothetical protein